jgi:hypothetical protein
MVEQSAVNRSVVGSSPTFGATLSGLCGNDLQQEDWPLSVKVSVNGDGNQNSPERNKTFLKLANTRVHKRE